MSSRVGLEAERLLHKLLNSTSMGPNLARRQKKDFHSNVRSF